MTQAHWDKVYTDKSEREVSWYAAHLRESLSMIEEVADSTDAIIDVGGGASSLAADLLSRGYPRLTVLDISPAALNRARSLLGDAAQSVDFVAASILEVRLPAQAYRIWHDRAVYHFLTEPAERATYRQQILTAVQLGGYVILATFALDGPTQCSGLPVCRYDENGLAAELGPQFQLQASKHFTHLTPTGKEQLFIICRFQRVG